MGLYEWLEAAHKGLSPKDNPTAWVGRTYFGAQGYMYAFKPRDKNFDRYAATPAELGPALEWVVDFYENGGSGLRISVKDGMVRYHLHPHRDYPGSFNRELEFPVPPSTTTPTTNTGTNVGEKPFSLYEWLRRVSERTEPRDYHASIQRSSPREGTYRLIASHRDSLVDQGEVRDYLVDLDEFGDEAVWIQDLFDSGDRAASITVGDDHLIYWNPPLWKEPTGRFDRQIKVPFPPEGPEPEEPGTQNARKAFPAIVILPAVGIVFLTTLVLLVWSLSSKRGR